MEEIITVFSKANILVRETDMPDDEKDIWKTIFEKNYSDCCSSLEELEKCNKDLYCNSMNYFKQEKEAREKQYNKNYPKIIWSNFYDKAIEKDKKWYGINCYGQIDENVTYREEPPPEITEEHRNEAILKIATILCNLGLD